MYRYSLILVAMLGAIEQSHAQTSADGMFDELSRDFGSVPRGQVLMHPFRIVNNTKEPVHIANVRVSCGICSSARALQTYLQPGQETAIIATLDTNRFISSKTITIFVTFDQPKFVEVRLWIQANSRDDVSFSPNDGIGFGRVKRGAKPESSMTITFTGGAPTSITEITSESNYVQPTVKQVQRANGQTTFEVTAKLREDTPAGKWYTDLWLKTNNPGMAKLRVPVTVEVEAPLSVNPAIVSLGEVKAGAETDRKVMIRGVRPFRILSITGTDSQLQVRQTNNDSTAVQVLTVTVNPREVGTIRRNIEVVTDLKSGGERITFQAVADVVK